MVKTCTTFVFSDTTYIYNYEVKEDVAGFSVQVFNINGLTDFSFYIAKHNEGILPEYGESIGCYDTGDKNTILCDIVDSDTMLPMQLFL